ncbi:MAG: mycothiol system anti-sigma-R factor [Acidimicrobiales bacterium]|jgi:mycothiol system anti-sigma-R factor
MTLEGRTGPPSGEWGEIDCAQSIHSLYDYLDGELTEDRRRGLQEHLDRCAPCVEKYQFEAELRRIVADRCKDHVPDALRQRVANAIDHERLKSQS